MRGTILGTLIAVVWTMPTVLAQSTVVRPLPIPIAPPVLPAFAEDLPPLYLDESANATLPNGTPVSRPLQPVEAEPITAEPLVDGKLSTVTNSTPLGDSWYSFETVLWWPSGQRLPPLLTVGRGNLPALGRANTSTLIGGAQPPLLTVGGRFTFGMSINESRTIGIEGSYMFLGNRDVWETTRSPSSNAVFLGRPVVNAATGQEDAFVIGSPTTLAYVQTSTTSRVSGWQATGVANLVDGSHFRLTGLAGYRYLMLNEGLRIEQTTIDTPNMLNPLTTLPQTTLSADQFDSRNRFNGGQVGLRAEVGGRSLFAEMEARVAIGGTVQETYVSGQSIWVPNGPWGQPNAAGYGVLAQPSNIGKQLRTAFAVVPEGNFRIGYKLASGSRLFVGYNFLYLSDAVRAGDQVDRTVSLLPGPWPTTSAAGKPAPLFVHSDFWLQGLTFGLEARY